jgi:threonine dehydratase
MNPESLCDLATIREAEKIVYRTARRTPMWRSASVAERVDCLDLHLKMENLQRTGSFKIRGATNKIAQLSDEERARGVVTASAGNHAQGVALAAREAGVSATVWMSRFASNAKVEATRGYGAQVVLEGDNFDEATQAAQKWGKKTGAVWVSAYDDPAIIAGQGTLGLEILDDLPNVDTVLVPVGGGGLFAGVASAIKALRPGCRVIGVQASGADFAVRSWRAGALTARHETLQTIADGIAVKSPSPLTFAHIHHFADDMVTVSDASLAEAVLLLLTRAKAVVEPSGAAGLAALLEYPKLARGQTVALLCGGNIDLRLLSDLIERGLAGAGRYARFWTSCTDRPGGLAGLLQVVAAQGASVVEVAHNRLAPGLPFGQTVIEMLVEGRGQTHLHELQLMLTERGYPLWHSPETVGTPIAAPTTRRVRRAKG